MGLYSGQHLKSYIIKDLIASGGMGEVWRAWDEVRGKYVAVKAITDDLFLDTNFVNRFLDEGRRHIKLSHPNIVSIFDVFSEGHQNCLVMEFIEGTSLADILQNRENHRLSVSESLPILVDLLNALNYAHKHGVIHRDVKPSNVIIDRKNSKSYLIDFGIALAVGEDRRTRTGQTVGTPHYMSPEQIVNPKAIDHRSDVYSVGCVFYEMLTGRPPFSDEAMTGGDTAFAIKKAHVNIQPVPPSERENTIPAYINDIIMLALQKNPENRMPGCQEFLRLLSSQGEINKAPDRSGGFRWVYVFALLLALLWLLFIASVLIK